jgi:hypothetical protein
VFAVRNRRIERAGLTFKGQAQASENRGQLGENIGQAMHAGR